VDPLDSPVEHVVHLVPLPHKQVPEQLAQILVIWLVLKAQGPHVVQVHRELRREALAEGFHWSRHLLLADPVILLLLGLRFQALPRKRSTQEIHEDVPQPLKVVAPRLLDAQVGVDTRVARSPRQCLIFSVGNVLVGLGVAVLLGQSVVNDVHMVPLLASSHQEIVRLDVAMQKILGVEILDTRDHLIRKHEDSLQAELAATEIEQVFQTWAEQIDHHDIVIAFHSVPSNTWDADGVASTVQNLVQPRFVQQLWVACLDRLQLDGHGIAVLDVCSLIDVSKRAAANLAANSIFFFLT